MTRFLASTLVLLALSVPAVAQPDRGNGGRAPFIPPKDANYDLFRGLLHFHGVKPLTLDEVGDLAPQDFRDVIVVVLGTGHNRWQPPQIYTQAAINNGGAVLIAMDDATDLSAFLPGVPARSLTVSGQSVTVPDVRSGYFQNVDFPFVTPVRPGPNADAPEYRLFAPLAAAPETPLRIVTNQPTCLVVGRLPVAVSKTVAEWPPNSTLGGWAAGQFRMPFALAGAGGDRNPYRALVMADPDVLSNAMLYSSGLPDPQGNQPHNWAFANRLITDFLRDGHARTKCLFVESGKVRTDFDKVELKSIQQMPSIPPIPLPDPLDRRVQAKLAEVIDGGLAKLEDRTVADNLLAGPPNDPSPRRYQTTMTVLAAAAGVVLVVLMARRLLGARHRKKFVPAPSDPLFLGDDTALGSFGQRRAELLRGTDFRAAVAYGVRTLFTAQGLPAGYGRRRLPPLQYRGRSDRERLGGDIRDLWDAAARDEAVSLSYAEWKDLEPVLAEVHAAADRWRFAPTSPQGSA